MAARLDWLALARAHPELSLLPVPLRATAVVRTFDRGEAVFRIGARPQAIHFLLAGEVRLVRRSRAGGEVILQRTRRGFFAEASLQSNAYHCDAVASQPSEVLRIPLGATREALDGDPAFRRAWIAHLSRELRRARAQGERLALKRARERILHYLESEGTDGVVTLTMSRKAWAAELGLTHETLYRTLARLEAERLVIRRGSELRLRKR
jgi:CRP-like cAMP-binding protein